MKLKIVVIATLGCVAAVMPAQAQLLRQSVQGVWRECVYRGPPTPGRRLAPNSRLGLNERIARVARGEPCPQTYPGTARADQARARERARARTNLVEQ